MNKKIIASFFLILIILLISSSNIFAVSTPFSFPTYSRESITDMVDKDGNNISDYINSPYFAFVNGKVFIFNKFNGSGRSLNVKDDRGYGVFTTSDNSPFLVVPTLTGAIKAVPYNKYTSLSWENCYLTTRYGTGLDFTKDVYQEFCSTIPVTGYTGLTDSPLVYPYQFYITPEQYSSNNLYDTYWELLEKSYINSFVYAYEDIGNEYDKRFYFTYHNSEGFHRSPNATLSLEVLYNNGSDYKTSSLLTDYSMTNEYLNITSDMAHQLKSYVDNFSQCYLHFIVKDSNYNGYINVNYDFYIFIDVDRWVTSGLDPNPPAISNGEISSTGTITGNNIDITTDLSSVFKSNQENTEKIIKNQNENNQKLIDNQNENNQKLLENQNSIAQQSHEDLTSTDYDNSINDLGVEPLEVGDNPLNLEKFFSTFQNSLNFSNNVETISFRFPLMTEDTIIRSDIISSRVPNSIWLLWKALLNIPFLVLFYNSIRKIINRVREGIITTSGVEGSQFFSTSDFFVDTFLK